jgi:hypothetical protein
MWRGGLRPLLLDKGLRESHGTPLQLIYFDGSNGKNSEKSYTGPAGACGAPHSQIALQSYNYFCL